MKKPSIEPKKRIFAQCSLSFHPKIPLKHLYFAVVIKVITYQYGNSLAQKNSKRLRVYTLPFIVKVLTFAP